MIETITFEQAKLALNEVHKFIVRLKLSKDKQSLKAIERQNALAFWLGFDFTLIKSTVLSIDDIGGLITAINKQRNYYENTN